MVRYCLIAMLAAPAFGQAMVESALGAGRAATTAAPAQKIGQSVAGIANSLSRTLSTAPADTKKTAATKVTTVKAPVKVAAARTEPAAPAQPAPTYEDPKGIEKGMAYDDVVRRFGPPAMQITTDSNSKSLSYPHLQVEIVDGKVASVSGPK